MKAAITVLLVAVSPILAQPAPGTVVHLDPTAKYDKTKTYTVAEIFKIVQGEQAGNVAKIFHLAPLSTSGGVRLAREKNKYGDERNIAVDPPHHTPVVQEYKIPVTDGDTEYSTIVLTFSKDVILEVVDKGKTKQFKAPAPLCYEVKPGQKK